MSIQSTIYITYLALLSGCTNGSHDKPATTTLYQDSTGFILTSVLPSSWSIIPTLYPEVEEDRFEITYGEKDRSAYIRIEIPPASEKAFDAQYINKRLNTAIKLLNQSDSGIVYLSNNQLNTTNGISIGYFDYYYLDTLKQRNFFRKLIFTKHNTTGMLEVFLLKDSLRFIQIAHEITKTLH